MRLLAKAGHRFFPLLPEPVCEAENSNAAEKHLCTRASGNVHLDQRAGFCALCVHARNLQPVETASLGAEHARWQAGSSPSAIPRQAVGICLSCRVQTSPSTTVNLLSAFCLPSILRAEAIRRIDPVAFLHSVFVFPILVAPEQTQMPKGYCTSWSFLLVSGRPNPADSCERCRSLP